LSSFLNPEKQAIGLQLSINHAKRALSLRTPNAPHLRFSDGGYRHLVTEKRSDSRAMTLFCFVFSKKMTRITMPQLKWGGSNKKVHT
jgi:hypothetical protein